MNGMQGDAERALRYRPTSLRKGIHFDADSIDSAIPRPKRPYSSVPGLFVPRSRPLLGANLGRDHHAGLAKLWVLRLHLSCRMREHYSHQRLKAKGQMLARMEERRAKGRVG
jgi:hypothetical protein